MALKKPNLSLKRSVSVLYQILLDENMKFLRVKTVLGLVPYPLCPVPGYDVGKVQKLESLELYAYLTLF